MRRMGIMACGREEALVLLREDELRRNGARGEAARFCDGGRAGRGLRDGGHSVRSEGDQRASGEDGQFSRDSTKKGFPVKWHASVPFSI